MTTSSEPTCTCIHVGLERMSIAPPIPPYSTESVLHSVLAGYAAGISGTLVGHPMDSLKVYLQTNTQRGGPALAPAPASLSTSASHQATVSASPVAANRQMSTLAHSISRPTGWNIRTLRSLYAGIGGPLATVGLVQSINFALYDSTRRALHHRDIPEASDAHYLDHDSLTNVTLSSVFAGSVLAFFTSPLLVIKTKQQIMQWNFREAFKDTLLPRFPGGSRTARTWSNFYVGFGPHLFAETVGRGVYFITYEGLKRGILHHKCQQYGNGDSRVAISLQERMMSAAAAGVVCWTAIFPMDAMRSRMYAQSLSSDSVTTTWQLAKSMYLETKSLKPFYRGFSMTVIRAGPVAAAVLPMYDTTLEWLSQESGSN